MPAGESSPQHQASSPIHATQRSAILDVLRALAVLLVMLRHAGTPPASLPEPFFSILRTLSSAGWFGVDLFFVLSGFLVSGLLFAEFRERQRLDLPRFFIRRGFKIYPPFLFFLAVTVAIQTYVFKVPLEFANPRGAPPQLWPELCFLQNYFWAYWNHTWSLALEEHFYILLPLILWLMWRAPAADTPAHPAPLRLPSHAAKHPDPFRAIPVVLIVILLLTFLWRAATIAQWPIETENPKLSAFQIIRHTTPTHLRIDSLMVGVFLGYMYHFHRESLLRWGRRLIIIALPLAALGIASCTFTPLQSNFVVLFGFPILAISFAMLIWILLSVQPLLGLTPSESPLPARSRVAAYARVCARGVAPLAFIGQASYSIYLWHMPAVRWCSPLLIQLFGVPPTSIAAYFLRLFAVIVGGCLFGLLAARLIEGPALRIRNRLFPSRTRSAPITTI